MNLIAQPLPDRFHQAGALELDIDHNFNRGIDGPHGIDIRNQAVEIAPVDFIMPQPLGQQRVDEKPVFIADFPVFNAIRGWMPILGA